jgi:hypothetical protein
MPRKKQVVQKQKRHKVYGGMSVDTTVVKPKGAFRFFTNYKLFAIIGASLIGGIGFLPSIRPAAGGTGLGSIRSEGVRSRRLGREHRWPGTAAPGDDQAIRRAAADDHRPDKTPRRPSHREGDVGQLLASEAPETVNNFIFWRRTASTTASFYRVVATKTAKLLRAGGDHAGSAARLHLLSKRAAVVRAACWQCEAERGGRANHGSQFFITLR